MFRSESKEDETIEGSSNRQWVGGSYCADGTCDHVLVGRMFGFLLGTGGGLLGRHFLIRRGKLDDWIMSERL